MCEVPYARTGLDLELLGVRHLPVGTKGVVVGSDLITVICVVLGALALATGVVWNARRDQQAKQVARWQRWESMQALKASTPGAELAEVAVVYQRARRGAKAVIVWLANGHRQDAWFEDEWPHAGSVLLLRGSTGWGPHNRNPDVFYVRTHQILDIMSAATRNAMLAEERRQAKRNARRTRRRG